MGTTNAALSLRRFTQTSFNFRFNSALPPPIPVVSPPLTPISPKSSLSSNEEIHSIQFMYLTERKVSPRKTVVLIRKNEVI
ncbi:hypothetical protein WUBG_07730 [Wuchereria bancrofti]|uniref:Uncharacterized protein n=1 Tax=Wuchereria bancrofti TaxID=6293 RepID=J9B319_WUCBA|nr:hypothetical protein WUBG_07730 [Wuchereria bancrofti]